MTIKMNGLSLTLAALALGTLLAATAIAQESTGHGRHDGQGQDDHPGRRQRPHGRRHHRRPPVPNGFLRSLEITDAQRGIALQEARLAAPIAESARDEARRILARAWAQAQNGGDRQALRESVRAQIKTLRENAFTNVEPLARRLLSTLTPEQRARIEAAAKARGRSVDEDRLVRRAAFLLTRRMTVPMLEARQTAR